MAREPIRSALELQGLTNLAAIYHSLPTSFLYEEVARRREGHLAHLGPLVVRTGHHTGRAPNDKFVVREPLGRERLVERTPPDLFLARRRHGLRGRDQEGARLLGERIARHQADVWLVNTGWTGGTYGTGRRMPIAATRALVRAAIDGSLRQAPARLHAAFGVHVPTACAGVPTELLDPRGTWSDGGAYDEQARRLADLFHENFRQFESEVSSSIASAGPPDARGGAS